MNIGMMIVNFCSAPLMLYFSGAGAEVANGRGYTMTAIVYSVISVPLFLIVFFTSRENVVTTVKEDKISISATIGNLVKNKYLMIVSAVMALQMTAFMGRIAVMSYWIIYCLGSFSLIAVITGIRPFVMISESMHPEVLKNSLVLLNTTSVAFQ